MRAVIQRVQFAHITIDQAIKKSIEKGYVVLLGIEREDTPEDMEWLAGKIARLRLFGDSEGKMNLSIQDIDGEIMLVSQFTLHASTKKGNRPSWIRAADPEIALPMYLEFNNVMQGQLRREIITGKFGAHMEIELLNDGPVTLFLDTKSRE